MRWKFGKRITGATFNDPRGDFRAELNVEIVLDEGKHCMSASPNDELVCTREEVERAGMQGRADCRLKQRPTQRVGRVEIWFFAARSAGNAVVWVLCAEQGQVDCSAKGLAGGQRCNEFGNSVVKANTKNGVLTILLVKGPPQSKAVFAHDIVG